MNKNNYVVCIVVIAVILLMLVALFKIGSDESSKNGDIRENAGESALSSSVGELRVEVVVRDGVRAESESEEETRIKT